MWADFSLQSQVLVFNNLLQDCLSRMLCQHVLCFLTQNTPDVNVYDFEHVRRCKAEIEAFEAANKNPSIITQTYTVRMNSPFFLDLDEGAITPMTVLAITALENCESVCGKRLPLEEQQSPDQCIAIAGVVNDASDLTVMKYCVPSLPSAGVRRVEEQTWRIPGTNGILNSIISLHFVDLVDGNSLLALRKKMNSDQNTAEQDAANMDADNIADNTSPETTFQTRIDLFQKGDIFLNDIANRPFAHASSLMAWISASQQANRFASINLQRVQGILVQPQTPAQKQYRQVMLYMNVMTSASASQTGISANSNTFEFSNERFNICGHLHLPSRTWNARVCGNNAQLWEEIDARGAHAIFVRQDMLALVPGGSGTSILSAGDGQIHFIQLLGNTGLLNTKRYSRPFQSSTWALTAGIPAAVYSGTASGDTFGFSSVTNALVRKLPMLSQVGSVKEFAEGQIDFFADGVDESVMPIVPVKLALFMSNNPLQRTHWLSEIRLDIPVTGETTAASYMSQVNAFLFIPVLQGVLIAFLLCNKYATQRISCQHYLKWLRFPLVVLRTGRVLVAPAMIALARFTAPAPCQQNQTACTYLSKCDCLNTHNSCLFCLSMRNKRVGNSLSLLLMSNIFCFRNLWRNV
jgi:hypothetical protein